jgi:hypothetical protein
MISNDQKPTSGLPSGVYMSRRLSPSKCNNYSPCFHLDLELLIRFPNILEYVSNDGTKMERTVTHKSKLMGN